MEITWYGRTCIRLRGKDAVVVADPYRSVVGTTGRGITADIVTFSRPDDQPSARKPRDRVARDGTTLLPTSLDDAFVLDGPGEYEVRHVLLTGVRTFRDDRHGAERGRQTAFVAELDGIHTIHLGDIGHLLTEERLAEIGPVDVACVPVGGSLSATKTAELIAQLDPHIVVPMAISEDESAAADAMRRFLHEMGAQPVVQARLSITPSTLPAETTTILLEQRGRAA
jgi:L-ascorbate metabolism protein UlaG (beta-lactamase superfamily)